MRIPHCSKDSTEIESGFAVTPQCAHEGRQVAIKIVCAWPAQGDPTAAALYFFAGTVVLGLIKGLDR